MGKKYKRNWDAIPDLEKMLGVQFEHMGTLILNTDGTADTEASVTLSFGYINGPLGFSLDHDGVTIEWGEMEEGDDLSLCNQARYILNVARLHGFWSAR